MKLTRIIAIGVIAASTGLMTAQAQSLDEMGTPAEFPPASYKGKQYVDSRGCVYIRAGIDGMTNWVPRVTSSRKVLCGYQPSLAGAAPAPDASRTAEAPVIAPKPMPKAAEAPAPAAKPVAKPAPVATAEAPAPKPVAKPVARPAAKPRVAKAAPKPATRKAAPRKMAKAPAPRAVAKPTPKPAPARVVRKAKLRTTAVQHPRQMTTCEGMTGSARYYAGRGEGVRCGPQAVSPSPKAEFRRVPVTVTRGGKKVVVHKRVLVKPAPAPKKQARAYTGPLDKRPNTVMVVRPGDVPPHTRIVPLHVWKDQYAAQVSGPLPKGFRKAWTDDRLNPKRAHQTPHGIAQTDLAWTRTVPRKLYHRTTGLVVTDLYPGLKYPYHSYEEMRAAGYKVSTRNEAKILSRADARIARAEKKVKRAPTAKPAPKARVSTRSTPQAKVKAAKGGRYVQVGTFGVPANAQKSAARLKAAGLPVRMGTLVKNGRQLRIVLAGPFAADQLGGALNRARKAGFHDAFVR